MPATMDDHAGAGARRRGLRRLALCALGALPVVSMLAGCQRQLLYHPRRTSAEAFAEQVRRRGGPGVRILPGFDALVLEPRGSGDAVATAIWFHGNAGSAIDRLWVRGPFSERRIRLVLAEYPGYAARAGQPTERALVDDATALAAHVRGEHPEAPLLLVGESLGAAVAVQAAATVQPSRLVLLTPFDDLARLAARHFGPWASVLLVDRYDSATHLGRYSGGAIAILVAGRDEVVGADGGHRLHDIARRQGDAVLVRIDGAGHNDWPWRVTSDQWTRLLGIGPADHGRARPGRS